jgi:primosomal protein N' (replication factor Y)
VSRYASVYPLVTTRALARPFTYEAPDDVERGAVVSVRLGGAKQRGVVVGLEEAPPEGIEASPIERVEESLPPALVELALWLADYYGSTPGRALALIAPPKRERRKELPQPAERDSLPGEPRPASLTESQERAVSRLTGALDGGGHFLLYGATGR